MLETELFQDARGRDVARVGLGLDAVEVQRVEAPTQERTPGLGRVTLAPAGVVEAVAEATSLAEDVLVAWRDGGRTSGGPEALDVVVAGAALMALLQRGLVDD